MLLAEASPTCVYRSGPPRSALQIKGRQSDVTKSGQDRVDQPAEQLARCLTLHHHDQPGSGHDLLLDHSVHVI